MSGKPSKIMSHHDRLSLALIPLCLIAMAGCADPIPPAPAAQQAKPAAEQAEKAVKEQEAVGCRVHGRIVSTAWRDLGGGIERAIVGITTVPESKRLDEFYGKGEQFELRLAPGKYRLTYSAVGTRGATFKILSKEITVAEDQDQLDVGAIDLPISKSTSLYGKQAPELEGIIGWRDTSPLALKDLRGKVIVLDFFAHYCTICHHHKPDLVKLRDKYQKQGLVVVAIHDSSMKTLDEMNQKMDPILQNVFHGDPPKFPIALDGSGQQSVFEAYGIYAVPAVILIDQQGHVVRRYHHAGKPELEEDVRQLLKPFAGSFQ
jgi:thiol-disulfide isomerase/thioredoxin